MFPPAEQRVHQPACLPLLYLVYVLWMSGLAFRLLGQNGAAGGLLVLAFIFLVCVFLPCSGGKRMFGKKTSPEVTMTPAGPATVLPEAGLTVIGTGAVVEGNILQGENVAIYGTFTGDIRLPEGMVHIYAGGCVRGNLSAATVLIDGRVEGLCEGQCVTVLEDGVLHGICRSTTFSITPGGIFIGTAEAWPEGILLQDEQSSEYDDRADGKILPLAGQVSNINTPE
ncbi:polymer-forming cytoskeletal protein [Salmonella enterica]|nr:polymer-forming cytoskeletal protein [Salmonella enterica]